MRKKTPSTPLRNLRRARTISQQQLARLAQVSQQTISKAERGAIRLSPDVEALIATILGASRNELFPDVQPESDRVAS